jgi:hypothetical protein
VVIAIWQDEMGSSGVALMEALQFCSASGPQAEEVLDTLAQLFDAEFEIDYKQ